MENYEKEIFFEKSKFNSGALKRRTTKLKSDMRLNELLSFIDKYIKEHSYSPSIREMMPCVNVTSTATIQYYLNELEERGLIKRSANKKRTLEIVKNFNEDEEQIDKNSFKKVPYIGKVAAGIPIFAEENYLDSYEIPKNLISGENLFILKIVGNSMQNIGILNGDKVVVEQKNDAENGEVIVAMIDGNATVKTFYREKDCIRLQPENPAFEPIYAKNVQILGKVVGLFRKF
ncbi:MAG: transcriptional repressor LexA [Clostridia bacterium]